MAWDEARANDILVELAMDDDVIHDLTLAKLAEDLDIDVAELSEDDLSEDEKARWVEYLTEAAYDDDSLVDELHRRMKEEGFSSDDDDDEDIAKEEEEEVFDDDDDFEDDDFEDDDFEDDDFEDDDFEDDDFEEERPKTALAKLVASYKY